MRMRRGSEARVEPIADDAVRHAAWDGIRSETGPAAVIRAVRAGDAVDHGEVRQVA